MEDNIENILVDCYNFIKPYDDGGNRAEDLIKRINKVLDSENRYFFCSFNGEGVGSICFEVNGFPSEKIIINQIKKKWPKMSNPVITSLHEWRREEFEAFIKDA